MIAEPRDVMVPEMSEPRMVGRLSQGKMVAPRSWVPQSTGLMARAWVRIRSWVGEGVG